jgi:hypothetical protein
VGRRTQASACARLPPTTRELQARVDDYYKKGQEAFKQELASSYSKQLETYRAIEQQKTEQVRGSIAERLEGTKAAYAQDAAKVQDEVTRRHKHLDAELMATTEQLKAGLDFGTKTRLSNAEQRVDAYKALWRHMAPLSPQSDAALDRPALAATFRKWYYDFGHGLFLTWEAQDEYLFATGLLGRKAEEIPDKTVREAFSALRTQMKIDIAVYTSEEGAAQVGDR